MLRPAISTSYKVCVHVGLATFLISLLFLPAYFESLVEGAFRGSTLLGAETQRVYEVQFEAEFEYSGEEVKTSSHATMDRYDEAFSINPPAGAHDLPERPAPDLPDFDCF